MDLPVRSRISASAGRPSQTRTFHRTRSDHTAPVTRLNFLERLGFCGLKWSLPFVDAEFRTVLIALGSQTLALADLARVEDLTTLAAG